MTVKDASSSLRAVIRRSLAIDQNLRLVSFLQTTFGRVMFVICAALLSYLRLDDLVLSFGLVLAACFYAYAPLQYQGALLLVASQVLFAYKTLTNYNDYDEVIGMVAKLEGQENINIWLLSLTAYFIVLCFAWGGLAICRRRSSSFFGQWPLLNLLAIDFLLLFLWVGLPFSGVMRLGLWAFFVIYSAHLWFIAYAFLDQRQVDRSSYLFQASLMPPFWLGHSSLPLGKGSTFLKRFSPQTLEDLAITQLKGIKLLVWGLLLSWFYLSLENLFVDHLGIRKIEQEITAFITHEERNISFQWLSLVWSQIRFAMISSYWGAFIIATARLAGFRLPRSTWRPLEARTMLDYFNRISYYFKEMLFDMFFKPVFFRYFKSWPRLRMFTATFMAAGVGNALYHFVRDIGIVAEVGLVELFVSYTSYLFYCCILATAICISQIRISRGYRPSDGLLGRFWSFACIWGFVTVLRIFSDETRTHSLTDRLRYLFHLFGAAL